MSFFFFNYLLCDCPRYWLWHVGFSIFITACKLLVCCGIWCPDQGLNLGPLNWEHEVSHWPTKKSPFWFLNRLCLFCPQDLCTCSAFARNVVPQILLKLFFYSSFRSKCKCHLLQDTIPDLLFKVSLCAPVILSHIYFIYQLALLFVFCLFLPPPPILSLSEAP